MFDKRHARKAAEEYQAALASWQHEHDELSSVLAAARTKTGMPGEALILKHGEAVFARVTSTSLVEMLKGAGHWDGRSQGVSIPIGSLGGRSVRYRVGSSKGHFVQGTPHPEATDHGTLSVTNQRIVFMGGSRTVECLFQKLVGIQQAPGEVFISVSNRQKPTTIHFGTALDDWFRLRLDLALSIYRGDSETFAESVANSLQALETEKPRLPAVSA